MEHRPNKKPRTEDGTSASSAATALASAESVAPAPKSGVSNDVNLGDGKDWKAMDHLSRLKFLTSQLNENRLRPLPETGFLGYLPKAVLSTPPSATMEAEMVNASKGAVITAVKAFFKLAEEADEEERDDDDSSDGYVSPTEGDGFVATTYR